MGTTAGLASLDANFHGVGKDNAFDGDIVAFLSNLQKMLALHRIEIASINHGTLSISQYGTPTKFFACPTISQGILIDALVFPWHTRFQHFGKSTFSRTW
jgi:hypothetical protein